MACSLIAFEGVPRPVGLVDCDHLTELFPVLMRGWRFRRLDGAAEPPLIVIRREGRRYRLDSPWLEQPAFDGSDVGIACCLTIDLVNAYIAGNPSLLCLHSGAAEFAGRLVVFPSGVRAGKSTLIARLAAGGLRVYADDFLAIGRDSEGVAIGAAPRLRTPGPANASPLFRRFVEDHLGPTGRNYLYLDLPPELLAPHGERAPVGAFVLLDRQASGKAELAPVSAGEGLQHAILQNISHTAGAAEIFARLQGLIGRTPCFSLRYSDVEDTAALLQDTFGEWPSHDPRSPAVEEPPAPSGTDASPSRPARPGPHYMRQPGVTLHSADDRAFLVDPESDQIYHLNPAGAGLWNLMSEPLSEAEAVDILHGAFPDLDRRKVRRDVATLFADLSDLGLIVAAPPVGKQAAGSR